jgi:hypothetical protein
MKIDKDFVVKVDGKVFTASEISSVSFDIDWFKMNCISENGTRFTVEASLKDVEFLSSAKAPAIETRTWTIFDGAARYSPRLWETNTEKSFFDSIREQIENDNDVMGTVRRAAVREAMKEAERERMRKGTTLSGGD